MSARRVIVVGLDCAPASLVFDRLAPRLPFLRSMVRRGATGVLRSCDPPITVPAWAVMTSGRDAGELGIYGFRDRVEGQRALRTATSEDLALPRVWDILSERGLRSSVLFVPPSHPARAPEGVELVSCLLAGASPSTSPTSLAAALPFDLRADVTTEDERSPDTLLAALEGQIHRHFALFEHTLRERPSDFAMMVEMAPDRLHHGLWPALDPGDPRHARFAAWRRRAEDVYVLLDSKLARLAEQYPDATLIVVSDHGARPLLGGVYVNEVLRRAGLLVLEREPDATTPLAAASVDWSRTRAWAEGGYYARVFVNDRVCFADAPSLDRDAVLDEIERALAAVPSERPHRFVRPPAIFRRAEGRPPDLLAYFGDLALRSLGAVGAGSILASADEVETAPGRGGCNHDWDGIFLAVGPGIARRAVADAQLIDVARTLLGRLGVAPPPGWQGRDLLA
jgi:predicted AlkP superfamily phosphohydrolase/phosphomutase